MADGLRIQTQTRFDELTLARIRYAAASRGQTMSEFIRACAKDGAASVLRQQADTLATPSKGE